MINISDDILGSVEKPSRYTGNEWNMVKKDVSGVKARFAFCFPDVYEVGMSHLGMKILYHILNERQDIYCERVFAPWVDMEERMRSHGIPLFSLETKTPVCEFDIVGFTLQYEMSYTNIINMLDLAGIPKVSSERSKEHPFVCAGGPCAYNPEPLAEIIDFFMLGEGEEIILEVMDAYIKWKNSNAARDEFLDEISKIKGIYVPGHYDVSYREDGTIVSITPKRGIYPERITKRIVHDFENSTFPDKIIVPFNDIIHDRIMLELFRGCTRGCRFCQAGFIYRPVRERSPKRLLDCARELEKNTGYEEISLVSLSTSDYTGLPELAENLVNEMEQKKVNLSLPSLRVDSFSLDLMEKASKVRKSGLTFAPEAGTQRLRDVINKGVTEDDLVKSVSTAFGGGWSSIKLYFMIGLPTENEVDIEGISDLAFKVGNAYREVPKEKRGKGLNITVSSSSFVPKPFTPFQWAAQDSIDVLRQKQSYLRGKLRSKFITYNWHDPEVSFMEAVFARGDRRTGKVLIKAWEKGCRFDGWGEHFKFDKWVEAFSECGIKPEFYANRERNTDEVLPWSHIDIGVSMKFFINERMKALNGETTPNCRISCSACGVSGFGGGICFEHKV